MATITLVTATIYAGPAFADTTPAPPTPTTTAPTPPKETSTPGPPRTTAPTPPKETSTPGPPQATTPAPPIPSSTVQPPGPPTDFRVTGATPTSVTLSWTASVPGGNPIANYVVNYSRAFDDIYRSQTIGNVTTVTITSGIQPVSQYTFYLLAQDTSGRTSTSPTPVTVMTPASATGDTTPPDTPRNLRITATTPTGPTLAWDPATDNAGVTGYHVYFFDGWYTSTLLGTTTGTTYAAPFMTGLASPGYYVRAKDAAGNLSIASNTVAAPVTPTPTPPARTCSVTYRTTAEWTGGFVAEVTITNTGATAIDGWTLTFATGGDQRISSSWNATFAQSGSAVTLTATRWNGTIPAGGTVTVGLLGRWNQSNAAPTSTVLNGGACA